MVSRSKDPLIRIRGGKKLHGSLEVSGSKNAALPILISSLLTEQACRFERVPKLDDIATTLDLLRGMGVQVERASDPAAAHAVSLCAPKTVSTVAPYDWVVKMRASVLVLGPLLARFGKARVSLPGGCAIGARPVNFHLSALEKLGARIVMENGDIVAHTEGLKGAVIGFDFPSVGATENLLMAAVLARGETLLKNTAREPEIVDLARSLRSMGAIIEGEGTSEIRIQGVSSLKAARHRVMGDRIEAGTLIAACLGTGGKVTLKGIAPEDLEAVLEKFEEAGAQIDRGRDFVTASMKDGLRATPITTDPFPGFPTDMQAQWIALMGLAQGTSIVTETIFDNRFMHVPELCRLGAKITLRGNTAVVEGTGRYKGAKVEATDLRASACLVIAGLAAEGETLIGQLHHLDRGYEDIEPRLRSLGADIERI